MGRFDELGEEIADLSAHLDAATQHLLECIRQFDEARGWYEQGALSCAHWLSWRVGLGAATAREKVRVARALGTLPAIDGAFRVGKLSYAKVRALTRVATPQNESQLLDLALYATGAQLERLCRGYRTALSVDETPAPEARTVRQRVLSGGMVRLEIVLLPDEADLVLRAINRAREVHQEPEPGKVAASAEASASNGTDDDCIRTGWPSRADGAVSMAESFLAGHPATGNGGEHFQVMVHLEQDALAADGGLAATLDDGTRVSAEALRRVACDSGIVAVGGQVDGESLNIGRRTRTIPPAIRRVLMLRDRGCAFPGCTHDRFLHGHHIQHWLHGGETSVDNLALLCTVHHHWVHEDGWTVARGADGELAFTSPTGETLAPAPARAATEDTLTWLQEWAEARGLDLGPDANEPLWDGTRPDYDWAVAGLMAR
jgi:hypothetical protein